MSYASPLADRRLVSGRAIARRMAALDPVRDSSEATHLSVEVLYGDAIFVHAAYTVAFARQVAIPSISRIVYRTGTGDMMRNVRKRNDDTLLFFGEMLRNGHASERGRAVIDRMERIHSRFGISDDDKLYTLASLALEADRILDHLGLARFTAAEKLARYHFWRGVGEYMGLTVPSTPEQFLAWTLDYERRFAFTDGGRALVDQLFVDWRQRWFPGRLNRFGDPVLLLLLDEPLRAAHRLPDPPARLAQVAPRVVQAYLAIQAMRPHRPGRSWVDHFAGDRGQPLDFAHIGHRSAGSEDAVTGV